MTYPPQDPYRQSQPPHQPPTPQPMPGQPQPPQQWPPAQPMPPGYPQRPTQPQWAPAPPGQPPQGVYPSPPAPPKKRTIAGKVVAGVVAGLVGLCCIGGIVAVATGNDTSTSTSGDTKAAAAPTTAAAATTQAAPTPPSGVRGLASWWNGGGKDRSAAIGNDFDKLSQEADNSDLASLRTTCAQAQKDVEAAQAYGQVPDAQAQSFWAAALASYARASSDCIAGLDTGNMDLVTKSGHEIDAGNTSLQQLTARIQEMGNGG